MADSVQSCNLKLQVGEDFENHSDNAYFNVEFCINKEASQIKLQQLQDAYGGVVEAEQPFVLIAISCNPQDQDQLIDVINAKLNKFKPEFEEQVQISVSYSGLRQKVLVKVQLQQEMWGQMEGMIQASGIEDLISDTDNKVSFNVAINQNFQDIAKGLVEEKLPIATVLLRQANIDFKASVTKDYENIAKTLLGNLGMGELLPGEADYLFKAVNQFIGVDLLLKFNSSNQLSEFLQNNFHPEKDHLDRLKINEPELRQIKLEKVKNEILTLLNTVQDKTEVYSVKSGLYYLEARVSGPKFFDLLKEFGHQKYFKKLIEKKN